MHSAASRLAGRAARWGGLVGWWDTRWGGRRGSLCKGRASGPRGIVCMAAGAATDTGQVYGAEERDKTLKLAALF